MDLIAHDSALRQEYLRVTGDNGHFRYVQWIAGETRAAIRGLHSNPAMAAAIWARRTKPLRHITVMRHLQALPPARWPSLQLVPLGSGPSAIASAVGDDAPLSVRVA